MGSVVISVLLLASEQGDALAVVIFGFATSACFAAAILGLHALTTPRRYEIHTDRLRLVAPIHAWDYRFDRIPSIDRLRGWRRFLYFGVDLSLGSAPAILIRLKGPPLFFRDVNCAPRTG